MFRKRWLQSVIVLLFLVGCSGDGGDNDHAAVNIGGAWIAAMHYSPAACTGLAGTDRTDPFLMRQNGSDIVITSAVFHEDLAISEIPGVLSETSLNAGTVSAEVSPDGMSMSGTYTHTSPAQDGCSYSLSFSAAKQPVTSVIAGDWKSLYTVTDILPGSSEICYSSFHPGQPVAGDEVTFVQDGNLITNFEPFFYISKRGIIAGNLFVAIANHTPSTPRYLYMKGTVSPEGMQIAGSQRSRDMICSVNSDISLAR